MKLQFRKKNSKKLVHVNFPYKIRDDFLLFQKLNIWVRTSDQLSRIVHRKMVATSSKLKDPPPDMSVPPEIEIRPSHVDAERMGTKLNTN
jgi:hypothetical protein